MLNPSPPQITCPSSVVTENLRGLRDAPDFVTPRNLLRPAKPMARRRRPDTTGRGFPRRDSARVRGGMGRERPPPGFWERVSDRFSTREEERQALREIHWLNDILRLSTWFLIAAVVVGFLLRRPSITKKLPDWVSEDWVSKYYHKRITTVLFLASFAIQTYGKYRIFRLTGIVMF